MRVLQANIKYGIMVYNLNKFRNKHQFLIETKTMTGIWLSSEYVYTNESDFIVQDIL